MVITLDGPSGTGKSTLAKLVAKELGFKFLNTGMIYRSLCHYFLVNGIMPENINSINKELQNIRVEIYFEESNQHIKINGLECTPYVSSKEVQEYVSVYSQILKIRKAVLNVQRSFAMDNDIVIEGRDIGSEVFPNADHKFYVECDINIRAKRRYEDLVKNGQNTTIEDVIKSLKNRDYLDKTREFSPLIKPEDAHVIDTSTNTIEQSLAEILSYIKN